MKREIKIDSVNNVVYFNKRNTLENEQPNGSAIEYS